jgi:hypothetical protein
VASEDVCPYSDQVFAERPSPRAFKEALTDLVSEYRKVPQSEDGFKQALVAGLPILVGFSVHSSFDQWSDFGDGVMPMPDGDIEGGHAVWACGYDATGVWLGNSWAPRGVSRIPSRRARPATSACRGSW